MGNQLFDTPEKVSFCNKTHINKIFNKTPHFVDKSHWPESCANINKTNWITHYLSFSHRNILGKGA